MSGVQDAAIVYGIPLETLHRSAPKKEDLRSELAEVIKGVLEEHNNKYVLEENSNKYDPPMYSFPLIAKFDNVIGPKSSEINPYEGDSLGLNELLEDDEYNVKLAKELTQTSGKKIRLKEFENYVISKLFDAASLADPFTIKKFNNTWMISYFFSVKLPKNEPSRGGELTYTVIARCNEKPDLDDAEAFSKDMTSKLGKVLSSYFMQKHGLS